MKKLLVMTGLLFLCQQFMIHVCHVDGKWLLMNSAAAKQSDEGFTEDSILPIVENTSGNDAKPAEPPAFSGARKRIFKKSHKGKYAITMYYPAFGNTSIDTALKQWVDTFAETFANEAMADPDCGNGYPAWTTAGTYSISQTDSGLLSIFFRVYQYKGGAHGGYDFACLSFDQTTGKARPPAALFTDHQKALEMLSRYCREELAEIEEVGNTTDMHIGTEPTSDHFSLLVPRQEGLLVVFYPGQVSCFAAGTRLVLVPWSILRAAGVLKQ